MIVAVAEDMVMLAGEVAGVGDTPGLIGKRLQCFAPAAGDDHGGTFVSKTPRDALTHIVLAGGTDNDDYLAIKPAHHSSPW